MRAIGKLGLGLALAAGLAAGGLASEDLEALRPRAAKEPVVVFQEAVEAYKAGDLEAARVRFEALSGPYGAPAVEYDLGNTWYQAGDLGRAVLHWERALLLDPRGADILHNLAVAGSPTVGGEGPVDWLRSLYRSVTLDELASAGGLGLALVLLGFAGLRLTAARRPALVTLGLGGALALVVGGWYVARAGDLLRGRRAVLVGRDPITATAGPGPRTSYPRVFDLQPGQVVRVHRESGRFRQVSLPTGAAGWVPRARVEGI